MINSPDKKSHRVKRLVGGRLGKAICRPARCILQLLSVPATEALLPMSFLTVFVQDETKRNVKIC